MKMKKIVFLILITSATILLAVGCFIVGKRHLESQRYFFFTGDDECYYWLENIDHRKHIDSTLVIPEKDYDEHPIVGIGQYAIVLSEDVREVIIGDNIEWISAFGISKLPNLQKVEIGRNVSDIRYGLFAYCPSLTEVVIDSGNRFFKSTGEAITSYDGKTLVRMWGKHNEIPETVESIGYASFLNNTELEEIIIPHTVKTIEREAFQNCNNLKYVFIPDSVVFIDFHAFCGCDKLEKIIIEEGVTISDFSPEWNYLWFEEYGDERVSVYIPYEMRSKS